jgi:hypothetical protein
LEQTEETLCLAQLLVWAADTAVPLLLLVILVALVAAVALVPAHQGQLQEVPVQQDKVTTAAQVELTQHHFLLVAAVEQVQLAKTPQTQVTEQAALA